MNTREVAKFLSGFAVAKVMFHGLFAASNILPIQILGCTLTPNFNFAMLIFWVAAAVCLIYYAWFKR